MLFAGAVDREFLLHFVLFYSLKGVAMARHGLILRQDRATASRNLFEYLPGLLEVIPGKIYI